MDGQTQSYMFKERLLKCEPFNWSLISVVLSWTSGRGTWNVRNLILTCIHRERNSKRSTSRQWCALSTKRTLIAHSLYILLKYMSLDLSRYIITTWHASDSVPTPHKLKQWPGTTTPPLPVTCAIIDVNAIQDEQHVLFHCTHPYVVSLRRTYASLFLPTGSHHVSFSEPEHKQ